MKLGPFGFTVDATSPDLGHIEDLGFDALWVNGGQLDRLDVLLDLLAATEHAVIAPAIIPPDVYTPADIVDVYRRAEASAPGRLIVGLGSAQHKPLSALDSYVDGLDEIPCDRRLLAAFGPRKLDMARDRFAGAVPGMVTPAYTATARGRLGTDAVLAVGQYVVLDTDPAAARATARIPLEFLLDMRSYADSARRQGFSEHDIETLSDALVDSMVAWGTPDDIAAHAQRHLAAGADHVYLGVLSDGAQPSGLDAARQLGSALAVRR